MWISAQTTFFTPGAGIFTPQSFFGAGPPFNAPPFGPGTPVEFLFLQPRSFFGQQIPPRTLPFQTGLFAGPAAAQFTDSTNLKFLHKLSGFYRAGPVEGAAEPDPDPGIAVRRRFLSLGRRCPT